jgi:Cytotoxic
MCWVSDNKDDTIASLAKILGVSATALNQHFQNPTVTVGAGFDVSGFYRNNNTVIRANIVQVFLVSEPPKSQTQLAALAALPALRVNPSPYAKLGEAGFLALYLYLEEQERQRWTYFPPPQNLPAFPDAVRVKRKNQRVRWKDSDGNIYEWDYENGRVEKYNRRGRHLGEFDPNTGEQTKPAKPGRTTEP